MNPIIEELERLIACACLVEIFRAITLEGSYQVNGATMSRPTYYETAILGWWPMNSIREN